MKKIIGAFALFGVIMLTACSRSVSMDKLKGTWTGEIDGKQVTIEITDDSFTQSADGVSGEALGFERSSDGLVVRNTDGRELLTVYYSEEDNTLSYTVQTPNGDQTYTFTK